MHNAVEHNLRNVTGQLPARPADRRHRRVGVGQVDPGQLHPLHRAGEADLQRPGGAGPAPHITGADQIDKVIHVDQSPIGRTPRSNPATYTGVFDHVRRLFAETPEAKVRGYQPGRFSFNVKGGRCENCTGDGTIKIEMNFLPDVYVPCEVCHGARYNRETLEVHYKGKTIAEVLDMPIEEAVGVLRRPAVDRPAPATLVEVGLGYVRLGQPAPTLSGGEAQRVKLASELQKRSTGRTLYVLDEPTTGLHFEDIRKLLGVLGRLVDEGNTVVVIEHNLDVIKTADWLIDMGPEGGSRGGTVIAEGTPEQIAANPRLLHRGVPPADPGRPRGARSARRSRAGDGQRRAPAGKSSGSKVTAKKKPAGLHPGAGAPGQLTCPPPGETGDERHHITRFPVVRDRFPTESRTKARAVASRELGRGDEVFHSDVELTILPIVDPQPELRSDARCLPLPFLLLLTTTSRRTSSPRRRPRCLTSGGVAVAGCLHAGGGDRRAPPARPASSAPATSGPAVQPASGAVADPSASLISEVPSGPSVATSEVPVGGGVILDDAEDVITQPTEGEFKAFSRSAPISRASSPRWERGRSTARATAASTPSRTARW